MIIDEDSSSESEVENCENEDEEDLEVFVESNVQKNNSLAVTGTKKIKIKEPTEVLSKSQIIHPIRNSQAPNGSNIYLILLI